MSSEQLRGVEHIARYMCKVPAYVTVPMAIAAYVILTAYGVPPGQSIHSQLPGLEIMPEFERMVLYVAASFGRFVIPPLLILPAIVWTFRFLKSRKLRRTTIAAASADVMATLTWQEFEKVVAQAFVNRGYDAQMTSPGADGGVDLVLKKEGKTYFVQCKHWKAQQVSADVVRSLYGVVQKYGASGAYVVTSGAFTGAASDFAKDLPVWLLTGTSLRTLISQGMAGGGQSSRKLNMTPAPLNSDDKVCPRCHSSMIFRTAKRGPEQGRHFWGCSQFPKCDGTRSAD